MLALRGWWLGTFVQVGGWVGFASGVATLWWVYRWVGAHWSAARPAVLFQVLAGACGVLVGALVFVFVQWSASRLREAVESSPWRGVDRALGVVFGAGTGLVFALTLVCLALAAPPRSVRDSVAHSLSATPLLRLARPIARWEARLRAGHAWLLPQLDAAQRRLSSARSEP